MLSHHKNPFSSAPVPFASQVYYLIFINSGAVLSALQELILNVALTCSHLVFQMSQYQVHAFDIHFIFLILILINMFEP